MTNSELDDISKLEAELALIPELNLKFKTKPVGQASELEIRPYKNNTVGHDEILEIVELVKENENLLIYIIADSSEPTIIIHRKGLIR
jgi:hypothetical protein